jgi:hypothetical protein
MPTNAAAQRLTETRAAARGSQVRVIARTYTEISKAGKGAGTRAEEETEGVS